MATAAKHAAITKTGISEPPQEKVRHHGHLAKRSTPGASSPGVEHLHHGNTMVDQSGQLARRNLWIFQRSARTN